MAGYPYALVAYAFNRSFRLVASEALLNEFDQTVKNSPILAPYRNDDRLAVYLAALRNVSEMEPSSSSSAEQALSFDDRAVVELARSRNVELVSEDPAVWSAADSVGYRKIIKPQDFYQALQADRRRIGL